MIDVYCPKCGRGYTEEIKEIKHPVVVDNKEYRKPAIKVILYRCNDCGYEFVYGVKKNEN